MTNEELLEAIDAKQAALKEAVEAKGDKKEVDSIKAELTDLLAKQEEATKELYKAVKEQGLAISKMNKNSDVEVVSNVKAVLTENADKLKKLQNGEIKSLTLDFKSTVVTADVQNSTYSQRIMEIGKQPVRRVFMFDLFNNVPVTEGRNRGQITYTDQDVLTRNADNVVSCNTIPESAINWIEQSCKIEKVGDSIKICRDALEDFDFIEGEINQFLTENVLLKADQQLLLGTGVTPQLKGVDSVAATWGVGVGSPIEGLATAIQDPTIYDVISTAITYVQNAGQNAFYEPTAIIMNPTDVEKLRLTKDADGNIIYPNALTLGPLSVRGIPVIPNQLVPQNTLYVGDFTKGTIYTSRNLTVEMADQHADDFIQDLFTVKATWRAALVIRNVWSDAFVKVDDIDAAITALTKP